jgi:hypothetical protein
MQNYTAAKSACRRKLSRIAGGDEAFLIAARFSPANRVGEGITLERARSRVIPDTEFGLLAWIAGRLRRVSQLEAAFAQDSTS